VSDAGPPDGTSPDAGPGQDAGPGADAAPPPAYAFVVYGDNQFATTSCTSGVPERLAVPEAIRDLAPAFVLHVGDLMDHGYDADAYTQFVSCYQSMLAETLLFPTPGNHDMGSGGIWNFKTYLEEQLFVRNAAVWGGDYATDFIVSYEDDPNTYSTDFNNPTHLDIVPSGVSFETFFAVKHANAYVISFEQGTRWWTNTPKTWLEGHLQAAHTDPEIDHVFVIMHHPMYSTTMEELVAGECVQPVREHYEQLFRDYDVTMVFAGHAHLYEHFYVPDDGSHTRQQPPPTTYPHDGNGIHYVITGGGGGPLPNGCSPIPPEKVQYSYDYAQARNCGYHVTQVEVDGARLSVSVIAVEGDQTSHTTTLWDSFTIE
jgi:hypothetical protein